MKKRLIFFILLMLICVLAHVSINYNLSEKIGTSFSKDAGFYEDSQRIKIKANIGCDIFYTLDGSEPTKNSNKYKKRIKLNKTTVVKAICLDRNGNQSPVNTATYFIGERKMNLPVVSLSSDSVGLFSDSWGIYVAGTNGKIGRCSENPVNWNQNWARKVTFEYFVNQKSQLNLNADIKIHGGCSRRANNKSFRLEAKKKYGENRFRYKFFTKKNIDEFKTLILRNGGNDWQQLMFRDALVHEICQEKFNIDCQAYQPVIVFLNGKYWGLYNLRERIDEYYIAKNHAIKHKSVTINMGSTPNSDIVDEIDSTYADFLTFLNNANLSDDSVFTRVENTIDVDNFIDYCIVEMYFHNPDWPSNNVKYWSSNGSKWRWILYDVDCVMGSTKKDDYTSNMFKRFVTFPDERWPSFIYYKLLENKNFRQRFKQRYLNHIEKNLTKEYINTKIDSIKNLIADEIPFHRQRWYPNEKEIYYKEQWEKEVEYLHVWTDNRAECVKKQIVEIFEEK